MKPCTAGSSFQRRNHLSQQGNDDTCKHITAVCREEELLRLTIDDSYEEDALKLDIWLRDEKVPIRGDVLYDGKRILTIEAENFVFS